MPIYKYSLFNTYKQLKQKLLPNKNININNHNISVDPFNVVETPQQLRPMIIKIQNTNIMRKLNRYHPLRILKYCPNDYRCHPIYEHYELFEFVRKSMVETYRKLFYLFDSNKQYCNICELYIDFPLEYHLCVQCKYLTNFRNRFWNHSRFRMANIASQINTLHHQLFMQYVIKFAIRFNKYPEFLWQIISGANSYDIKYKRFIYKYDIYNISRPKNKFYRFITSLVHQYLHMVLDFHNKTTNQRVSQIQRFIETRPYKYEYNLIYHIRNDTYLQWTQYNAKFRPSDIIVATDSSHKHQLTGIGIFIKNWNQYHYYSQPLGNCSNNYGELYAINKSLKLFDYFHINTTDRRIIIVIDSQCWFIPLITTPRRPTKLKYFQLYASTQKQIIHHKATLWKVKSHTKPLTPIFNKLADDLANHGRQNIFNSPLIPSELDSMLYHFSGTYIHSTSNIPIDREPCLLSMTGSAFALVPD